MTKQRDIELIGIPLEAGAGRRGCVMGPDGYRTAGLAATLSELGHIVTDRGNIAPDTLRKAEVTGNALNAATVAAWTAPRFGHSCVQAIRNAAGSRRR